MGEVLCASVMKYRLQAICVLPAVSAFPFLVICFLLSPHSGSDKVVGAKQPEEL